MTLSSPEVSRYINEQFVPCWQTVRPVPQVTIDFGNGRLLHRTLAGNTILSVCLPDGHTVDAMPGVYTPEAMLQELKQTREFLASAGPLTKHTAELETAIKAWHQGQVTVALRREAIRITTSKAVVESPLLRALGINPRQALRDQPVITLVNPAPAPGAPRLPTTISKGVVEAPLLRAVGANPAASSSGAAPADPIGDPRAAFEKLTARIDDLSKHPATVSQLRAGVGTPANAATPEEIGMQAVAADSKINVTLTRPAVHLLFAGYDRLPADLACRDTIYTALLHVPVSDPYLGLTEALVPGTPGGERR